MLYLRELNDEKTLQVYLLLRKTIKFDQISACKPISSFTFTSRIQPSLFENYRD